MHRKPRTRIDLIYLADRLETILFRDVALAAIDRQLLQRPNEVARKNLEQLRLFASGKGG